jgi:cytochrome P450
VTHALAHLIWVSTRSLVWSGRIPNSERITIVDNGTEQQHEVVNALIGIKDKQEHARRKRPWSKGFSTSALKDYESFVIKRILQLMKVLSSKNLKETIDLTQWITYFGYVAIIFFSIELD